MRYQVRGSVTRKVLWHSTEPRRVVAHKLATGSPGDLIPSSPGFHLTVISGAHLRVMKLSRRQLLAASTVAGASLAVPGIASAAPSLVRRDRPTLPSGIASADVTPSSAVVWSKTDRPGRLVVQLTSHGRFDRAIHLRGPKTSADDDFTARLPQFKDEHPHLIAAEMRFTDSTVARCDHVIQGGFSDEVGTQLTPIAVHRGQSDGCFTVNGKAVRVTAADPSDALLLVVKDPDPAEARAIFRGPTSRLKNELPLDADTSLFFVWPIASKIKEPGEPETRLFVQSGKRKATDNGVPWLLTLGLPRRNFDGPRLVADAVAVAGVRAVRSARRRAVILLLSTQADESHDQPSAVR